MCEGEEGNERLRRETLEQLNSPLFVGERTLEGKELTGEYLCKSY
jgi:hypothetical protein